MCRSSVSVAARRPRDRLTESGAHGPYPIRQLPRPKRQESGRRGGDEWDEPTVGREAHALQIGCLGPRRAQAGQC
jgi:hypothetical protein